MYVYLSLSLFLSLSLYIYICLQLSIITYVIITNIVNNKLMIIVIILELGTDRLNCESRPNHYFSKTC